MAYYFDKGLWYFGSFVESKVDSAGDNAANGVKDQRNKSALVNAARARMLDKLLGENGSGTAKFKDPVKVGAVR